MTSDDEILFKDEVPTSGVTTDSSDAWKILVVDDEADVHSVTEYMLKGREYRGRPFQFLHAYSAKETKTVLAENPDVAVILLDVVMETDDAGLLLVKYIREDLKNKAVRIILRTGQPGKAPAAQVILDYDIDDYKEKTELTVEKMVVTLVAALRSYSFITTIEENRQGLRRIIEASSDIFERQSLQKLGCGVLGQLTSILRLKKNAMYTHASGLAASGIKGQPIVLAGTGEFCHFVEQPMSEVEGDMVHKAISRARTQPHGFYCEGGKCAWYFQAKTGSENFLYFEVAEDLDENDKDLLELFFTNVSLAFDNLFLNKGIEDSQKEVIFHIAETMDCRSVETGSHVRRVSEYVRLLALKYGLGEEEAEGLKLAATAHDLGKIGIPDAILNKPGPLTPEEYEIIKGHVQRGYDMLIHSTNPIIQAAALIVLLHHERFDGQGYPRGLAGDDIDISGRIVALADVFDALSTERVYREAWSWEEVFTHIQAERGKHFDPRLVDILLENREEFIQIWSQYQDECEVG